MLESRENEVFQYRRTGVLARTCAGEDACTPAWSNRFPIIPLSPAFQHSNEVIDKIS
jgi:hypothetical protein